MSFRVVLGVFVLFLMNVMVTVIVVTLSQQTVMPVQDRTATITQSMGSTSTQLSEALTRANKLSSEIVELHKSLFRKMDDLTISLSERMNRAVVEPLWRRPKNLRRKAYIDLGSNIGDSEDDFVNKVPRRIFFKD